MNDEQLLRYSRHILLPEIGIEGAGEAARGARAGDRRRRPGVAGGPLPRLGRHRHDHARRRRHGRPHQPPAADPAHHRVDRAPKVASAATRCSKLNPEARVVALLEERLAPGRLDALVARADVVLDCSDNFTTRHAVEPRVRAHASRSCRARACASTGRSASSTCAQASPLLQLPVPEDAPRRKRCAVLGVFAPLVGIIGATQAAEALKLYRGRGRPARRTAAAARCAEDGVAVDPVKARPGLRGLSRR